MFRKFFTPDEAKKRLPLVHKIVAEILTKGKTLRQMMEKTPKGDLPPAAAVLREEIGDLMAELEELGCYYKDWNFEIGLVDFPAVIDGQIVFLCWRSDEEELKWYHGLEEGYPGRKPIPLQQVESDEEPPPE